MRLVLVTCVSVAMAYAMPQAVTSELFPQPTGIPEDCVMSWEGRFAIQVISLAQIQKRDTAIAFAMQALNGQVHVELPSSTSCGCNINGCHGYNSSGQLPSVTAPSGVMNQTTLRRVKRDTVSVLSPAISTSAITVGSVCQAEGVLSLALIDSVLRDSQGRIGYLASNRQFQFDSPPQSGALVTAGFSICSNGSLALGHSATWWACSSGTFSKLYDRNWAAQCSAIQLKAVQVVNCAEDPIIVTAGSLSPNATAFLAALANTPVDLPSRTWGPPANDLTSSTSVVTGTVVSSNLTLSNPMLVTGNRVIATPISNLTVETAI